MYFLDGALVRHNRNREIEQDQKRFITAYYVIFWPCHH